MHRLSVNSPQAGTLGTRYVYTSWSDGGARSHRYKVPGSDGSVAAHFKTQYYLTVSSAHGTATGEGWYDVGVQAQFSINSAIQSGGSGIQYLFTGWTGIGDGYYTGIETTRTVTLNNPITETAGWGTQYYLGVGSPHGTVTGSGWYDAGSQAQFSVDPDTVLGSEGIRYIFTGWNGTGAGSYTGNQKSNIITLNNPITETAVWRTQYYLTISENPDVGGDVVPPPPGGWYDSQTQVDLMAEALDDYAWTGWSGDLEGLANPVSLLMDSPKTVVANFRRSFDITVGTLPEGLAFTVDDQSYTTTQTFRWVTGSNHTLSVNPSQEGESGVRYIYGSWSDGGERSHTYTVENSDATITANFQTQYYLTILSEHGTVSGEDWYDAGSQAEFSIQSDIESGGEGTRYIFTDWAGVGVGSYSGEGIVHSVTMTNPLTETAVWETEYYLSISGIPAEGGEINPSPPGGWYRSGTVVNLFATVGTGHEWGGWSGDVEGLENPTTVLMDSPNSVVARFGRFYFITIGTTPGGLEFEVDGQTYIDVETFNWLKGSEHTLTVGSTQGGLDGTRNVYTFWSDGGDRSHTYTVGSSDDTLTAHFRIQYFLRVESEHGTAMGEGWYDPGSHVELSINSAIQPGVSGIRYRFTDWLGNGAGSYTGSERFYTVIMNNPIAETAVWQPQYYLSTSVNPVGGGNVIPAPPGGWYDGETIVGLGAMASSDYAWIGWSGDLEVNENPTELEMDSPKTVVANFGKLYDVTVGTHPDGLAFMVDDQMYMNTRSFNWVHGSYHQLEVISPQEIEPGSRYIFRSWSDGGDSTHIHTVLGSGERVIAYFGKQHYLSVNSIHGEVYGTGWYDESESVEFGVWDVLVEGVVGERFRFKGWIGDGMDSYTGEDVTHRVVLSNPMTETVQWDTLYLLTTQVNPESGGSVLRIPDKAWYKKGETVTLIAIVNPDGLCYFEKWHGEVEVYSDTLILVMNRPYNIQADFRTLTHRLKINVSPDEDYGRIEVSPDLAEYVHNTPITLSAFPNPGYAFKYWDGTFRNDNRVMQFMIQTYTELTAHFTNEDNGPPYIADCYPSSGAEMVPLNIGFEFQVRDDICGIDLTTLNVSLPGQPIIQSGTSRMNGYARIEEINDGYNISYHPAFPFSPSSEIRVYIECDDLAYPPNRLQTSYNFSTGEGFLIGGITKLIPPSGGSFGDNTGALIDIPNNALTDTTAITLGHIDNPPALPDTIKGIGLPYYFSPDGLVFNSEVTITLPIGEDDLKKAGILYWRQLKVYYFQTDVGKWLEIVDFEPDSINKTVMFKVNHFSYFQMAGGYEGLSQMSLEGFAKVYNYPNPVNPNESSTHICYQLSEDATITLKIYDVSGGLVLTLLDRVERSKLIPYRHEWDCRNGHGELVANDVYFCVVESRGGDRVIRKIAVLR